MERIKNILVEPNISIKEALKRMDTTANKILTPCMILQYFGNGKAGRVNQGKTGFRFKL